MAGETTLTVIGNCTDDAALRFTSSGVAVANWTIASTPRTFDRNANEWKDGDTLFLRCSIWREAAENVAETLTKGTRVIVTGRLHPTKWEDRKTGETRYGMELQVDEVGPSLRYATAKVQKAGRGSGNPGGGSASNRGGADPWATGPAAGNGWGGGQSQDDPPF